MGSKGPLPLVNNYQGDINLSKKRINILYIIGSLNSGGAERQLVELAKALDKSRFRVYIVIYHDIIHYKEILDVEGVTVKVMEKKFKYDPTFPFKLAGYCKEKKIDIIHAYSESAGFWSRLAGKLAGIKTIMHIQNTHYSPGWFRLEKNMGWMDAKIIANSVAGKEEYKENIYGRDIRVIQNGLNFDLVPKEPGNLKESNDPENLKIICVGRISKQKNQLCLIRALNRIKNNLSGVSVDIWGRIMDQKIFDELMQFIKESKLEDVVYYKKTTPKIIEKIASADLMVLTSLWEGFPNVVMESLACETPVIASSVADMEYLVKHGENGFLFPKNDDNTLAIKLLEFYNLSPQNRRKMGKAGREHILKNYTIEIMARETEKVYDEILSA